MLAEEIIEQFSNHDMMSMLYQVHLSYFVSVVIFKNFFIVVQLQLSPFSPVTLPCPTHPPNPTFNPPLTHCLCPWVLYTYSLPWPFPFFLPLKPFALPSGHCQFVLYFHVSGSILLIHLFCWLSSTYRWIFFLTVCELLELYHAT